MTGMRKRPWIAPLAAAVCVAMLLAGCSDGDHHNYYVSPANTVTRYSYNLNYNDAYHRVAKLVALDNGDNTFEVKAVSYHFFARSTYQNRTGGELCDMVRTGAVAPSSSSGGTIKSDTTHNINMSTGKDVFNLRAGLSYTYYYYF